MKTEKAVVAGSVTIFGSDPERDVLPCCVTLLLVSRLGSGGEAPYTDLVKEHCATLRLERYDAQRSWQGDLAIVWCMDKVKTGAFRQQDQ